MSSHSNLEEASTLNESHANSNSENERISAENEGNYKAQDVKKDIYQAQSEEFNYAQEESSEKSTTTPDVIPPSSTTQKTLSSATPRNSSSASKFLSSQINSILKTASKTPKKIVDTVQLVGDSIFTVDENSERQILRRQMNATESALSQMNRASQVDTEYDQDFFEERSATFMSPQSPYQDNTFDVDDVYALIDEQQREINKENQDLENFSRDVGEDSEWVLCPEDFESDPLDFLIQFQSCATDDEKRAFLEGFQKTFKSHLKRFNSMNFEHKEKLMKYHREIFPHILSLLSEQDWNESTTILLLQIIHEVLDTDLKNIGLTSLIHFWSFLQILNKRMIMDTADANRKAEREQKESVTPVKGHARPSSHTPTKTAPPNAAKKSTKSSINQRKTDIEITDAHVLPSAYTQLLLKLMKKFRLVLVYAEKERSQDLEFSESSLYNMINTILISLMNQRNEFIPELHYYMVRYRARFSAKETEVILGHFYTRKEMGSWVLAFVLHSSKTREVFANFFKCAIASKARISVRDLEFIACLSSKDPKSIAENSDAIFSSIAELEEHTQHRKWLSYVIYVCESLSLEHPSIGYRLLLDLWRVFHEWSIPLSPHDFDTAQALYKMSGMIGRSIESDHFTQFLVCSLVKEVQQNSSSRQNRKVQQCFEALSNIVDGKPNLLAYVREEISKLGYPEKYVKHPDADIRRACAPIFGSTEVSGRQNNNLLDEIKYEMEKQRLRMAEMELEIGKLKREARRESRE